MGSASPEEKLSAVKQKLGRDIRVYETVADSSKASAVDVSDEPEEFYEFTVEDYYRVHATKKKDKPLMTRKTREAELAARRSKYTKATIKVRFPDNCTLETTFHPSETIQNLVDLLKQVVSEPERPFYIYTTPPKKQLKDMSQDFFSAGFIPGAIVYFSYDMPKEENIFSVSGPFLEEEILSLKGLEITSEEEPILATKEISSATSPSRVPQLRATDKKPTKPKWLKR